VWIFPGATFAALNSDTDEVVAVTLEHCGAS